MNNTAKSFRRILGMAVMIGTLTSVGCKKDGNSGNGNSQSIVGDWSNATQVGSFRNTVTQKIIRSDGTGNEYILSVTTGSSTPISDLDFNWNTEKDSILNLNFVDGTKDRYTYKLDAIQERLLLTNEAGVEKEYFKL